MILTIYFIWINLLTFIVRWVDKFKSMKGWWRISEKQLLTLVALGGFIWAFSGMNFFRHKTIKGPFLLKLYALIIWRVILAAIYLKDPELLQELLKQL